MSAAADKNLLFGILALQMDFITRDQLVAGMNAWVLEKHKPLGQIMIEQGALDGDNRAWLDAGVERHLAKHNDDPQQSLAALSPLSPLGRGVGGEGRSLRQQLHDLADPDMQASLAALDQDKHDSELLSTKSYQGADAGSSVRFRILRPHAEGGLGKVSVARDEELSRDVALKEIKERYADDRESRSRFLREAEITGGLEHPGIVPVYSLGSYADGRPFYAMRFIRGESLWEAIREYHRSASGSLARPDERASEPLALRFRQLLGRFIDVCQAIQYAHDRGVLHRDLKPGNVMLGKYGETLVVDWGLAKARGAPERTPGTSEPPIHARPENDSDTQPGKALGTPAFMSPEQAGGQLDQLGPSSDVYSLGATLYCLLTGHAPIEHADSGEMLRRAQRGDFRRPREVNPRIDSALEAICLKAMALKQQDRYIGTKELAEDVEHWLADEPVTAYGEPWPVRAGRWTRKHKTLVASAAAALLVAVIGSIAGNLILSKANQDLAEANEAVTRKEQETNEANVKLAKEEAATKMAYVKLEKEQKATELARDEARKSATLASDRADEIEDNLATATMQLARARFEENNAALADELLEQVIGKHRQSPWRLLKNYVSGSLYTLRGHVGPVTCVEFCPDGRILASGSNDSSIILWDAQTGKELRTLRGHQSAVFGLAFSQDGNVLASGSADKVVRLWDTRTGRELRTLHGHQHFVMGVAFSPNGQTVATGSIDNTVRLWDANTGKELHTLRAHRKHVNSVAFSPDGQVLASASSDRAVKVWDARTGKELRELRGHGREVWKVTFSSDGRTLATASNDKTIKLWEASTGAELRTLRGHQEGVNAVTFSHDGQTLVSSSGDQTAKIWDPRTGHELRTLRGHKGGVISVTFSADGQAVATGSNDRAVKVWLARSGEELHTHQNMVMHVMFSPDGHILACDRRQKSLRLINGRTGLESRTFMGDAYPQCLVFSPDGRTLACGGTDKTIKLWDTQTGQLRWTKQADQGVVTSVAFNSDGRILASGGVDKTVKLWDGTTGQELRTLRGHKDRVSSVTFSPDGLMLASGSDDRMVTLWDVQSGRELRILRGHEISVSCVTFSPDGIVLASGGSDKSIKLWDCQSGLELRTLRGHKRFGVTCLSFSPDGKVLASGSDDQTVKLWDARSGQELRTLFGHQDLVKSVTFSPDGQILASVSKDKTLMLWDTRTALELRVLRGHRQLVTCVAFNTNGQTLASGSVDQTVRLWDVLTGRTLHTLVGHEDGVTNVSFSPDGTTLATASHDNSVRIWQAHNGQPIHVLRGHKRRVRSVSFSPDGKVLASCSDDDTVRLWNSLSGMQLRTLPGWIARATFSTNGRIIFGRSIGKTLAWEVETGKELSIEDAAIWADFVQPWNPDKTLLAEAGPGGLLYLIPRHPTASEQRYLATAMLPDVSEHHYRALEADKANQPFAAACRLGHAIAARLRLQVSPWDPASAIHVIGACGGPAFSANAATTVTGYSGLEDGRLAQTAFVDGATFAGILLKDSGRSAQGLVVRAQWAVDQWPQGWQNREVLGGALYRAGDYKGAVRELIEAQKLRGQIRSSNPQASFFSCHFLTLAHHKLGDKEQAEAWRAKAVLPKDANWEDAMIDRYLRREVEVELK